MHLMVVVEDRISEWQAKGEVLEGYFNPDGAFDTITVLGLVADDPGAETLARLCAPARHLYVNAGIDRRWLMAMTAGLRPGRLVAVLRRLARQIDGPMPDVMRAYGDGLAAVAAAAIRRQTAIPYAVSIHTTADLTIQARYSGARDRIWRRLLRPAVHQALRDAGAIMAVYEPIRDFLPADVAEKTLVVPNVVGIPARPGIQVHRAGPLRALWLGRQMPGRDPRAIIAALEVTPNVTLTLIGDGPLLDSARRVASPFGDRTRFIPVMDNRNLCTSLGEYDVLVVNSGFREIPKTVMEASLVGLPVVVNRLPAAESPEYSDLSAVFVDGSPGGYAAVLRDLEGNPAKRRQLAHDTQDAAWRLWNPFDVAAQAADVLRGLTTDAGENGA